MDAILLSVRGIITTHAIVSLFHFFPFQSFFLWFDTIRYSIRFDSINSHIFFSIYVGALTLLPSFLLGEKWRQCHWTFLWIGAHNMLQCCIQYYYIKWMLLCMLTCACVCTGRASSNAIATTTTTTAIKEYNERAFHSDVMYSEECSLCVHNAYRIVVHRTPLCYECMEIRARLLYFIWIKYMVIVPQSVIWKCVKTRTINSIVRSFVFIAFSST